VQPSQVNTGKPIDIDAEAILTYLTHRQHLLPLTPVSKILEQTTQVFGCCPLAIERGLQWLKIDADVKIGRLRRSELIQLSRAIHRFWMQGIEAAAADVK